MHYPAQCWVSPQRPHLRKKIQEIRKRHTPFGQSIGNVAPCFGNIDYQMFLEICQAQYVQYISIDFFLIEVTFASNAHLKLNFKFNIGASPYGIFTFIYNKFHLQFHLQTTIFFSLLNQQVYFFVKMQKNKTEQQVHCAVLCLYNKNVTK